MIIKQPCIYPPKGKDRPLHIYLPENYYESDERYPVMYFFDGHNLYRDEDATYGKSWGLEKFLDENGKKGIVVGIECGHEGYERLSEYLPYPADRDSHFAQFEPMGEQTMSWIVNDIKPMIDKQFRTIPFRECTGIAGSSMGGLMALYAAVHFNRWFSKAGCVSSAIGFCMGPLMDDIAGQDISPDTRFYLSWGTEEAYGLKDRSREDTSSHTYWCNRNAAEALERYGAAVRMRSQVGGHHCEADWEKLVPEMMRFLWEE